MIQLILPILIPYLILAIVAGLFGKRTKIGFWGVFVLSILLTPAITLIVMLFLKENHSTESVN